MNRESPKFVENRYFAFCSGGSLFMMWVVEKANVLMRRVNWMHKKVGYPFFRIILIVSFVLYLLKTRSASAAYAATVETVGGVEEYRRRTSIANFVNPFLYAFYVLGSLLALSTLSPVSAFFASIVEWLEWVRMGVALRYFEATFDFKDGLTFVGTVTGVGLLFWRAKSADKQVKLNEDGLDADRFREGCQLLTEDHYSARHAGIVTLSELARANPKLFEVRVIDVLTDFLRRPDTVPDPVIVPDPISRPDMHQAFRELTSLWSKGATRRRYCKLRTELNLENVYFCNSDFENLCLQNVSFLRARFVECSFSNVDFRYATMEETRFEQCSFSNPNFEGARMSKTDFQDCHIQGAKWNGVSFYKPSFSQAYKAPKVGLIPNPEKGTNPETIGKPALCVGEKEIVKAWVVWPPNEGPLVGRSQASVFFVLQPERWGVLTKFSELTFEEVTGLKLPEE